MPVNTNFGTLSIGRDVTIDVVLPTGLILRTNQITDFDAKYQSTLSLVKGDVALGRQLGIKSTPTFFINGVKVEGALPPQYFDQAIAYELQRAGSK